MLLRISISALIFATVACGQLKTAQPLPKEQLKAESLKILKALEAKPEWLFGNMACPSEVMPANAGKPKYMSEGCKDNPGRCLERCQAEDPSACYALALLTEEYAEPANQGPQALYLRSCRLGIASGCTNRAANIAEMKPDDPHAQKCATDTFQKTCDQNDSWGCSMLGFALYQGIGRPKNIVEAEKALRKACETSTDKSGPACKNATELMDRLSKEKP